MGNNFVRRHTLRKFKERKNGRRQCTAGYGLTADEILGVGGTYIKFLPLDGPLTCDH